MTTPSDRPRIPVATTEAEFYELHGSGEVFEVSEELAAQMGCFGNIEPPILVRGTHKTTSGVESRLWWWRNHGYNQAAAIDKVHQELPRVPLKNLKATAQQVYWDPPKEKQPSQAGLCSPK